MELQEKLLKNSQKIFQNISKNKNSLRNFKRNWLKIPREITKKSKQVPKGVIGEISDEFTESIKEKCRRFYWKKKEKGIAKGTAEKVPKAIS